MKKTLLMTTLLTAAVGLSFTPAFSAPIGYQTEVLSDSPYLYYRLNEASGTTAADTSGNSRPGTYTGTPTLGVAGSGTASDNAATFNGSSDYALTSNALSFGSLLGSASYEFVFKTTDTASANALFGTFNTGSTTAAVVSINENASGSASLVANSVRLFLRDESGVSFGAAFVNTSLSDGSYHHLLYTYDATGLTAADRVKAYFDGAPQTLDFSTTTTTPSNFASFGFDPTVAARNVRGTIGQFFDGTVDEAAIYGSVLTATDALEHTAAAGIPEPTTFAMLLGGVGLLTMVRRRRA